MSKLQTAALAKAAEPARALAEAVADGKVQMTPILKAVGIDPSNTQHQAMLLVAQKYDMDPLMGHVMVLPKGGKPYITRDGYLHVAHRSGQLDGIEVLEETETPTAYRAKVAVWRKDMSRPFTFTADYPKNGGNKEFAKEMALTRAERRALKRAFNISDDIAQGEVVAIDAYDAPVVVEHVDVTVVDTPALAPVEATLIPEDAA